MENVHGTYNPCKLLDFLRKALTIETDAKLAARFGVRPPLVSKIRHGTHEISSEFLIKIHEATGISILGLREIMGDRRSQHRYRKNKNSNCPLERSAQKRNAVNHLPHP